MPIAQNVGELTNAGDGYFSVSPAGVLAYQTTASTAPDEMTWFSRAGQKLGTVGQPDVSVTRGFHRRDQLAVGVGEEGKRDIWVYT